MVINISKIKGGFWGWSYLIVGKFLPHWKPQKKEEKGDYTYKFWTETEKFSSTQWKCVILL